MLNWSRVLVITLVFYAGNVTAETQLLIVNVSNGEHSLSMNAARAIFSMRVQRWPDGTPVSVIVLPDQHFVHRSFTRNTLSLFPYQVRRSWDRYVYSGTGTAPIEVKSEEEMMATVAAIPGSIGYVSKEVSNEKIRTLLVQ